jgi:hypothetical protein
MKRKMLVLTALAVVIMLAFSPYGQAQPDYNLKVTNKSGMTQTAAVYQTYPNVTGHGFPLVWFSRMLSNGQPATFNWRVNWSLGWGTPGSLKPGVVYLPSQTINVEPGGTNEVTLSYVGGTYEFTNPRHDPSLSNSQLAIITDESIPVTSDLAVSIGMSGKPTFALQPIAPNSKYVFETTPTYYLCITQGPVGSVIDPYSVHPTKLTFPPGVYSLCYILNDVFQFIPCN